MFVVPATTSTSLRENSANVCPLVDSGHSFCESELAELNRLQKSIEGEGVY